MDPLRAIRDLGRTAHFKAGDRIYCKGLPADEIYIVTSGELLTTGSSPDGREVVVYRMNSDYGLGPLTVLCGGVYDNDCVAQTDCELIVIKAAEMRSALRKDHDLALHILDQAVARLKRRTQQWEDASILCTGARLCKWLLEYASKRHGLYDGARIEMDVSERIIGLSLGGISRESVSRTLGVLARAGVIARTRKTFRVLNVSTLDALANGTLPFPSLPPKAQKNGHMPGISREVSGRTIPAAYARRRPA
jgi:CRP-like cAMP-binding protein